MGSLGRVVEKICERRGPDWAGAPGRLALWPREPAPVDVPEVCSRYPTIVLFCGVAAIGAVLIACVLLVVLVAAFSAASGPVVAPPPGRAVPVAQGVAKMKPRPAANAAPISN
jgi:hypothetical protein